MLAVRNYHNRSNRTSTTSLTAGSWHTLELHARTGANGLFEVWVDGMLIPDLSAPQPLGTRSIAALQLGDSDAGHAWNISYDDTAAAPHFLGR